MGNCRIAISIPTTRLACSTLNAALLHVFGSNVLPSRILLVVIRLACALMVYGLARRLAPPPFAAVPR